METLKQEERLYLTLEGVAIIEAESAILFVDEQSGKQFKLLEDLPYSPFLCPEGEWQFCYHWPARLREYPNQTVILEVVGTEHKKITLESVPIMQKSYGIELGMIMKPHFLAGALCLYTDNGSWTFARFFDPQLLSQFNPAMEFTDLEKDTEKEAQYCESILSPLVSKIKTQKTVRFSY